MFVGNRQKSETNCKRHISLRHSHPCFRLNLGHKSATPIPRLFGIVATRGYFLWGLAALALPLATACHPRTQGKQHTEQSAAETLQALLRQHSGQTVEHVLQTQRAQEVLRKQEEAWQSKQEDMRTTSVGRQQIIRITPKPIDGVPVEGAEQVLTIDRQTRQVQSWETPARIEKQGDFKLDARQAAARAYEKSGLPRPDNARLHKVSRAATKVWLNHNGILRPSWKITLLATPLEQSKQVWVDAENGAILKQAPLVHFATETSVFPHAPAGEGVNTHDLERAVLEDLAVPLTPGSPLMGKYMHVRNCCWYSKCPAGKPACQVQERICARQGEAGAAKHRVSLRVDAASDPALMRQLGRTQPFFISAWRCLHGNLARYQEGKGFQASPSADGAVTLNAKALDDPFAEIQAYHVASSFFRYLRGLMGNDAWCLRESGMACQTDGSPTTDNAGLPTKPFRIHVNYASPRLELQNVANQLQQGRGGEQNPVLVDAIALTENAAFLPALPSVLLESLSTRERLENLWRDYDHVVLHQGHRRDYAYDGDVVAHEIGHALAATLAPALGRRGWDAWGPQVEPGALNEGWADYFAAAFAWQRNIPGSHAVGEYAAGSQAGLRSLTTVRRCPDDVVGDVHHDSLIWSGALWTIRTWISQHLTLADVSAWDRLVLSALAQATTTESFARQSAKLLALARGHPTLGSSAALKQMNAVFADRGVSSCDRVFPLARVAGKTSAVDYRTKPRLYHPSPQEAGLSGDAPPIMQLRVDVPVGGGSLTLRWRQVSLDFSSSARPMEAFITEKSSLRWEISGSLIKAKTETFSGRKTASPVGGASGLWEFTHSFSPDSCQPRAFYISLLNPAGSWRLENIQAHVAPSRESPQTHAAACQARQAAVSQQKPAFPTNRLAEDTPTSTSSHEGNWESLGDIGGSTNSPRAASGGCRGNSGTFDATVPLLLATTLLLRNNRRASRKQ